MLTRHLPLIQKGQLILKGLFSAFNSSKKTQENEKNRPNSTMIPQVEMFLLVVGRIEDLKLTELY
jgi:hypothetical protein